MYTTAESVVLLIAVNLLVLTVNNSKEFHSIEMVVVNAILFHFTQQRIGNYPNKTNETKTNFIQKS